VAWGRNLKDGFVVFLALIQLKPTRPNCYARAHLDCRTAIGRANQRKKQWQNSCPQHPKHKCPAIIEGKNGVFKAPPFSYKPSEYVTGGNITSDSEIFSDFVSPFTAEDEKRIVSLTVRVYAHGRLEYDDVFGQHHWLT
jgi:hypothetical protein